MGLGTLSGIRNHYKDLRVVAVLQKEQNSLNLTGGVMAILQDRQIDARNEVRAMPHPEFWPLDACIRDLANQ